MVQSQGMVIMEVVQLEVLHLQLEHYQQVKHELLDEQDEVVYEFEEHEHQ